MTKNDAKQDWETVWEHDEAFRALERLKIEGGWIYKWINEGQESITFAAESRIPITISHDLSEGVGCETLYDYDKKGKGMSEIPRRNRVDKMKPAELAIRKAMSEVEEMGADSRLTDAVILLDKAQKKVADYIDDEG